MTGIVTDIKNIAMKELPVYVVIAALLSLVVLGDYIGIICSSDFYSC